MLQAWPDLPEEELLNVRFCELGLKLEETALEKRIARLYEDLDAKGIDYKPPCYLGDDWFSSDGAPTIAIPFFLAHSRLTKLEEKMMLEAEGAEEGQCLQLLRHEAGHALCHAYRLDRTKAWKVIFGSSIKDYEPDHFRPKPYSKNFVQHLGGYYAQSHPDEDFAETFATWLTPDLDWRKKYKGWRALKKLEYVDLMMKKFGGQKPKESSRDMPDAVSSLRSKLKTYYRKKRALYAEDYPDFHDKDLRKIFDGPEANKDHETAYTFMRRNRKTLVKAIARITAERKFVVGELVGDLTQRCRDTGLRLGKSETETIMEASAYLARLVTTFKLTGRYKESKV